MDSSPRQVSPEKNLFEEKNNNLNPACRVKIIAGSTSKKMFKGMCLSVSPYLLNKLLRLKGRRLYPGQKCTKEEDTDDDEYEDNN